MYDRGPLDPTLDLQTAEDRNQLYARTVSRLVQDHLAHCVGISCDISLPVVCEMAERAGATFTDVERKLFL